jgi:hypothetical protein
MTGYLTFQIGAIGKHPSQCQKAGVSRRSLIRWKRTTDHINATRYCYYAPPILCF